MFRDVGAMEEYHNRGIGIIGSQRTRETAQISVVSLGQVLHTLPGETESLIEWPSKVSNNNKNNVGTVVNDVIIF